MYKEVMQLKKRILWIAGATIVAIVIAAYFVLDIGSWQQLDLEKTPELAQEREPVPLSLRAETMTGPAFARLARLREGAKARS